MTRSPLFASSLVVAAILAAAAPARAEVPASIPFAGRLVHDGTPVSGAPTVTFRLYDTQVAGSPLWEETHANLGVVDGLVYARLGTLTDLDPTILDGSLFLEITVVDNNGTNTFLPRLPIESVPYALHAATADALGDLTPDIVQQTLAGACPANQALTGIDADGTIHCDPDDDTPAPVYTGTAPVTVSGTGIGLSTQGCGAGDVWKYTGSGWSCDADTDTDVPYTGAGAVAVIDHSIALSSVGCSVGELWKWSGTAWSCEADANTTYTAGAGLSLGGTSFGLSTAGCVAGEMWKWNGSAWSCEPDANTTYTAGSGLALTGTSFAVDTAQIQRRVTGGCAAGQAVRAIAADGTVTCEPKASRTFLGSTPLPGSYAGTPSAWTKISAASFDLQYAMAYKADFLKPGQTLQGRVCAWFTDSYEGQSHVNLRIRHRDNPNVVYYAVDLGSTWSLSMIYKQICGAWVDASVLNACTSGFSQGTCDLDVMHANAGYTIIREVTVELAAVN